MASVFVIVGGAPETLLTPPAESQARELWGWAEVTQQVKSRAKT